MTSRLSVVWGRWCLPTFNKHCDQLLKGALADQDNHLCDRRPVKTRPPPPPPPIVPWDHPTMVTFVDSYGI